MMHAKSSVTSNLATIASVKKPLPVGKSTLRFEFAYDGGGQGKGGVGSLLVNGQKVGEGRIERTQPFFYSADEGVDVGEDGETPVTENYGTPAPHKFTGKIGKVTVAVVPAKPAEKAAADGAQKNAALKKALAD